MNWVIRAIVYNFGLCFVGFHKWVYTGRPSKDFRRYCSVCYKEQNGEYLWKWSNRKWVTTGRRK